MAKFNELTEKVKNILIEKPATRSDDYLLILEVLKTYDIDESIHIGWVFQKHTELALPSIHSIIRLRRLVQQYHPELTDNEALKLRQAEERKYKKWAREAKQAQEKEVV